MHKSHQHLHLLVLIWVSAFNSDQKEEEITCCLVESYRWTPHPPPLQRPTLVTAVCELTYLLGKKKKKNIYVVCLINTRYV